MNDDLKHEMDLLARAALQRAQAPRQVDDSLQDDLWRHVAAAASHADVDNVRPEGRARLFKRVLLRVARIHLRQQGHFNRSTIASFQNIEQQLRLLRSENESLRSSLSQSRRKAAMELASYEIRLDELASATDLVAATVDRIDDMAARIGTLQGEDRRLGADLRALRFMLDQLVEDLRRTGTPPSQEVVEAVASTPAGDEDTIYERFEDEFRGSREEIAERLRPYLDDVWFLRDLKLPVIDLGTGRGEWLALLADAGIEAIGVDLNSAFVDTLKNAGLDARLGDAFDELAAVRPGSAGAITAFQFVEHFPVDRISTLLDLAAVALAPGGLLLLETPNPSNLRVGACAFYRDPTHVRPVHPELLSFLFRQSGFVGVETRFINPSAEYTDEVGNADLIINRHWLDDVRWSLYGPQDYVILGRKPTMAGR